MKNIFKLFLTVLVAVSLFGCWGDDNDSKENDDSTNNNKLNTIKVVNYDSYRGKYKIISYKETKEDNGAVIVDSANADTKIDGEMTVETNQNKLEYFISYSKDMESDASGGEFRIHEDDSGRMQIDPSGISPSAKKVYKLVLEEDKYTLVIQIDGLKRMGFEDRYNLYMRAKKISNNPLYSAD